MYQNGAAILIQAATRGKLARMHAKVVHGKKYEQIFQGLHAIQLPSEADVRSAHKIDEHTLMVPYKSTRSKPKPAWEQVFETGTTSGGLTKYPYFLAGGEICPPSY